MAVGGGGKFEGGGSLLLISGVPLPSSASSKISLATKEESLSATIPPLLGNSGEEDALPKDILVLSTLDGIPEENAGPPPPPAAPFRGALPNEPGGRPFFDGIPPRYELEEAIEEALEMHNLHDD